MATTVFAPSPRPETEPPSGGAEVVYLDKVLFVIRASIEDPVTGNTDRPLPPHRFALIHTVKNDKGVESATTGESGIAVVPNLPPSLLAESGPDDLWDLLLIPVFESGSSDEYGTYKEAFLDVDAWKWVLPSEVCSAAPSEYGGIYTTGIAKLQPKRRVLRIPAWSTARKAALGGGFLEAHPQGAEFATKGTLKTTELKQHGTSGSPWKLRLDHEWLKRHVAFIYYDVLDKKNKPLPKGVVVQVIKEGNDRFAGSSVRFDDGTFYVLIAGDEAAMKDKMNYSFATPKATRFPYGADFLETMTSWEVARLATHRPVAHAWCSRAMEAFVGPGDPSAANRKPFADLRLDGKSKAAPVTFHLDDIVLMEPDKTISSTYLEPLKLPSGDTHTALFDHNLILLDPDKSAKGGPVGRSKKNIKSLPLRAEEFYYVPGKGIDGTLRLIEYEGGVYEIAGDFNERSAGFEDLVGARSAQPPIVVQSGGQHKTYLIDTTYLSATYQGKTVQVAQLFLHVTGWIDDSWLLGSNTNAPPVLDEGLLLSSEIWTQLHPAMPSGKKKNYAIVPATGDPSPLLRVRYHYSARAQDNSKGTVLRLEPQGRATTGSLVRLYLADGSDLDPPKPSSKPAEAATPYEDIEPKGATDSDPMDGATARWFTLAHELGHVRSLPDEYLEGFAARARIHSDAQGSLPRFQQSSTAKPFHGDWRAMMKGNMQARIRYAWPIVDGLNKWGGPADHWSVKKRPFVAEYRASKATMRYTFPTGYPWGTTEAGKISLSHVALYELGDDESSRGAMFLPDGKAVQDMPFDGVAVIYPQFWFTFGPGYSALERWDIMRAFGEPYFDVGSAPHVVVNWPSESKFKRVALWLQPRFEYGPAPSILDPKATPIGLEKRANATIGVEVVKHGAIIIQVSSDMTTGVVSGAQVTLPEDKVNHGLMRFALNNAPTVFTGAMLTNGAPLQPADFSAVAGWVAVKLGRSAGTLTSFG